MANKKLSDTISQQRKARQDFLELKKMQHGDIAPPPKPSEEAVMPKTFLEKLQNYWFHFKWHTIGIVATILILIVFISQCANRVDWDMKVVYFTYTPILDQQLEPVADYFEKICNDINGDSEVNINVVNCSISTKQENGQFTNAAFAKLQSMIAADPEALIFITDSKSQEFFKSNSLKDIFYAEQIPLNDEFYSHTIHKELGALPEGLQINYRKVEGTTIENDKNVDVIFNEVKNIMEKLK